MFEPIFSSKNNQWREYVNPLRGVTLESIVSKIELGEKGSFADVQWFYQAMERSDALIATVIGRRRAALLSCSWDVLAEQQPGDPVLAREQASYLRDCYDAVENLKEAVAFLATCAFRGYAHVEKHYAEDGSGRVIRLEPVEQWFWVRDGMFGDWAYNRDAKSGEQRGERIERGNFVIVEAPLALDRILAVQYFKRNLAMTDWTAFLDTYGIPSTYLVGPPGLSGDRYLEFVEAAKNLVKDGRGFLPNGSDIKYVTGGNAGRPPFRDHLDYLDKQITLLGTGGLLTMLTESGSGTLAGSAHQEAFNQVAKSDAVMVSEALQRDFDKPRLERAFPGWPVEASFCLMPQGAAEVSGPLAPAGPVPYPSGTADAGMTGGFAV